MNIDIDLHRPAHFARIVLLLLLCILVVGSSSSVQAADSISDAEVRAIVRELAETTDMDKAWQELTEEEKTAVMERGLTVSDIQALPELQVASTQSGCWIADRRFGAYSPAGIQLFNFGQYVEWCGDGKQVTIITDRYAIGEPLAPFWAYRGVIGDSLSATPATQVTSYYQGKFEICYPVPVGCVEERNPWIRFKLNADGSWSYEKPDY